MAIYNKFKVEVFKGIDLVNDTIKVALLNNAYSPNVDHNYFSDVSANEITGTGYTTGGKTLTNPSVAQDDTNDKGVFDADDVTWSNSTITARYAVIYKDTGATTTSPLIEYIDFGEDKSSSAENFKITWNVAGIINSEE